MATAWLDHPLSLLYIPQANLTSQYEVTAQNVVLQFSVSVERLVRFATNAESKVLGFDFHVLSIFRHVLISLAVQLCSHLPLQYADIQLGRTDWRP